MDGFSYTNIFETKGIEYLIIIAFLLLIIPFWLTINKQARLAKKIRESVRILSAGILRIPLGIFHSKYHTWAHMGKSGLATVGIDDFLQHITGELVFNNLKSEGDLIKKGELLAEAAQSEKTLKIYSPLSGRVVKTNSLLQDNPGIVNEDPFGKGWIYTIRPTHWIADTSTYFLAEEAVTWTRTELTRFKDFLAGEMVKYSPDTSLVILQDGGELCDKPLSGLPTEVWQDFQKSFLS